MDKDIFIKLLAQREFKAVRSILDVMNEVDIASLLSTLSDKELALAFRLIPKDKAAEVFSNMDTSMQTYLVTMFTEKELKELLDDLYMDDTVDMLEELPANLVKRILATVSASDRSMINQLLNYPKDSAGSIMTTEYVYLHPNATVEESFARIRKVGMDKETIYTCYVTQNRVLLGVVTVRSLLLAKDELLVRDLMEPDVISVPTTADQEEAVRLLGRYNFLSLPVVDGEGRLVGIVTVDDAVDVLEQEATEDFEKMAAMTPSERPYLKTGVFELAKHRILWLLVLMISGMLTGGILGHYEAAFAALPMLVTFIPMLTDTGGNAGSQSSTLIIRGLAVNELSLRDLPKVLWKELRVSLLVGVVLSAVNFVRLALTYPGNELIALTVAITMLFTVMLAKTIGGALPLLAKALHMDPAIMASPLITTIVDAASLVIYFSVAQALLPI